MNRQSPAPHPSPQNAARRKATGIATSGTVSTLSPAPSFARVTCAAHCSGRDATPAYICTREIERNPCTAYDGAGWKFMAETHVVTGAFGFTGKHIAQRLIDAGVTVRTLTSERTVAALSTCSAASSRGSRSRRVSPVRDDSAAYWSRPRCTLREQLPGSRFAQRTPSTVRRARDPQPTISRARRAAAGRVERIGMSDIATRSERSPG